MKKRVKWVLIALEIILVVALFAAVFFFQRRVAVQDAQEVGEEELAKRYVPSIQYQDQSYPLKRNVSSLLLIGTDDKFNGRKEANVLTGYFNYKVADFLVLLVFDNNNKTITPFQICRDTMCQVESFDVSGKSLGMRLAQICLAHTSGTGKEDSAQIVRDTARRLLFDVPIDSFISIPVGALPIVNDLVGGVTVTLNEDIPALKEKGVAGTTVTLMGMDAQYFITHRNTEEIDGNLNRMSNHRQYIEAFTKAAQSAAANDPDFAAKLFKAINPYICTNMSIDALLTLLDNISEYEILPFVHNYGAYDWKEGEDFPGYYVDEDALFSIVKSLYCE